MSIQSIDVTQLAQINGIMLSLPITECCKPTETRACMLSITHINIHLNIHTHTQIHANTMPLIEQTPEIYY